MSRREEAEDDRVAHASDHGLDAVLVAAHVEERGSRRVRQPAVAGSKNATRLPSKSSDARTHRFRLTSQTSLWRDAVAFVVG